MADYLLYGTEGCHLCEEAELLLQSAGLDFETQDIIDDESLQQRYGVRIPVLWHRSSGLELGWPFAVEQLNGFLASVQSR